MTTTLLKTVCRIADAVFQFRSSFCNNLPFYHFLGLPIIMDSACVYIYLHLSVPAKLKREREMLLSHHHEKEEQDHHDDDCARSQQASSLAAAQQREREIEVQAISRQRDETRTIKGCWRERERERERDESGVEAGKKDHLLLLPLLLLS